MAQREKHPKGLMILFFTEMWERFGFYLMLGIFTLYMVADSSEAFPGLGFNEAKAADIYGTYLALVYLTPFFGGFLADRYLGYRKSIYIGGSLMALGYLGLAIPNSMPFFFMSLLLIILGNGMFKPNISVLVGKLYEKDEYKHLKDSGFNIFYMGINIGAFICNFVAAYLRLTYGWGFAFAAAGIGMILGIIWFALGNKNVPYLKEVDVIDKKDDNNFSLKDILIKLFVPAFILATLFWIIPGNIFGADSTDAFLGFSIVVVIFYVNIYRKAEKHEKTPIAALLSVFALVIVFWAVFHQNGSALTYWAKYNTKRELNTEISQKVLSSLKMIEHASTAPRISPKTGLHGEFEGYHVGENYYFANYDKKVPVGNLEVKDNTIQIPDDISQSYTKEFINNEEQSILNDSVKLASWYAAKKEWLSQINIENEKDIDWKNIPDETKKQWGFIKLWPTELQMSINPGYIVIVTPLIVGFFAFLRRRKKEPTTPQKIGYGLLITALSMLVMVVAAILSKSGVIKASVGWLFGVYGVITVGELFLSPMGLSFVSKLSPKRIAALMMGGWFLSTAIGNKLSGVLSGLWNVFERKEFFFLTNTAFAMISVILIFIMMPWLKRVVKDHLGEGK
ncbi:MAG: peptide MFS transporter [Bacteroidales bacterium]|nr:peptide MFS transporter [Bacteroidales bacterium]